MGQDRTTEELLTFVAENFTPEQVWPDGLIFEYEWEVDEWAS